MDGSNYNLNLEMIFPPPIQHYPRSCSCLTATRTECQRCGFFSIFPPHCFALCVMFYHSWVPYRLVRCLDVMLFPSLSLFCFYYCSHQHRGTGISLGNLWKVRSVRIKCIVRILRCRRLSVIFFGRDRFSSPFASFLLHSV